MAALAATTGTVAVLATASASSQPSAPPWPTTIHSEEHGSAHSVTSTTKVESHSVRSHSRQVETISSHPADRQSSNEGDCRHMSESESTRENQKNYVDFQGNLQSSQKETGPDSAAIHSHETNANEKNLEENRQLNYDSSPSKFGEISMHVNTIAQELAHDTVMKTEEISRTVVEKEHEENASAAISQKNSIESEETEADEKKGTKQKPGILKLKRQTKSVDRASSSDKSEFGNKNKDESITLITLAKASNEDNNVDVSSHSSTDEKIELEQVQSRTAADVSCELKQLHDWANSVSVERTDVKSDSAVEHLQQKTNESINVEVFPPNEDKMQHETSFLEPEDVIGEVPTDLKAEEIRFTEEGSVRKSSAHDIREETDEDGLHVTTEEKAEETKEEKREGRERTVLERKSNVQVDENGDTVEEEITITRTEQSSRHETTVSKSWTMETTIETLADGETHVIERMILHTPPSDVHEVSEMITGQDTHTKPEEGKLSEHKNTFKSPNENQVGVTFSNNAPEIGHVEVSETKEVSQENVPSENIEPTDSSFDASDIPSPITIHEKQEFGLMDAEEARKSMEHITIALANVENSLDLLQQESHSPDAQSKRNDEIGIESTADVPRSPIVSNLKDTSNLVKQIEVDEYGNEILKQEFGLISPDEAKKSIQQITAALAKAEETLGVVQPGNDLNIKEQTVNNENVMEVNISSVINDTTQNISACHESVAPDTQRIEVDETGEEVSPPTFEDNKDATDKVINNLSKELKASPVNDITETHNEASIKAGTGDEISHQAREREEEISLDNVEVRGDKTISIEPVKKKLSKYDTEEESPKELSFQANDYPTDEDQITPREEVESLRVDTPEDSSATKTSSESDENGELINPPTVVISRTADVIELKDGELNIVTQMEKEGLVFKDTVNSGYDEAVDTIITKGALQTLSEEEPDNVPTRMSTKVAGITVASAATIGLIAAEREKNTIPSEKEEKCAVSDSVEVVPADFDIHQFIHQEAQHTSRLLNNTAVDTSATHQKSSSYVTIKGNSNTGEMKQELLTTIHKENEQNSELFLEENQSTLSVESFKENEQKLYSEVRKGFTEALQENKSQSLISDPLPNHDGLAKEELLNTAEELPCTMSYVGSDEKIMDTKDRYDIEMDENGKPIPVDENGKPIHMPRKKRSLEGKPALHIGTDSTSEKNVNLGSLPKEDGKDHWYASPMSVAGSTLITPVLAMSRGTEDTSLQPCDEPECVAIDVREMKKKDVDLFRSVSQTTSAAGQAILEESDVPIIRGPLITEGMDVMREMSRITSRVGQSILALGTDEKAISGIESTVQICPPRSDSQESFKISDDAVYIPLNPPGMKRPELERIDSVVSLTNSFNAQSPKSEPNPAINQVRAQRPEGGDEEGSPKSRVSTAATTSPVTYTVTDPRSKPECEEDGFLNEMPSEKNQDDDVLIVEYPTDPDAKVTKWENVVVTSPADRREVQMERAMGVQKQESVHVEAPSQLSMDDSLQEVPSLQDEAVMHLESECELLESMPEEEGDRKWTDDVAKAASQIKEAVKGVLSRVSSVQSDLEEKNSIQGVKVSATADDPTSHSIFLLPGVSAPESSDVIKRKATPINQEVGSVVCDTKEKLQIAVHDVTTNVTSAVTKVGDVAQSFGSEIKAGVEHNSQNIKDSVLAGVGNMNECVGVVAAGAETTVTTIKETVPHSLSWLENCVDGMQDVREEIISRTEDVETGLSKITIDARDTLKSAGKESKYVVGASRDVARKSKSSITEAASDTFSEVKSTVSAIEENIISVPPAVSRALDQALPSGKDLAENLEHGIESAALEFKESTKSLSEDANKDFRDFKTHFGSSLKGLDSDATMDTDYTPETLSEAVNAAESKVTEDLGDVASEAKSVVSSASKGIASVANIISCEIAQDLFNNTAQHVQQSIEESASATREIVKHSAGNTGEMLRSAKEDLDKGGEDATQSISKASASTGSKIKDAFDVVVGEVKSTTSTVNEGTSSVGRAISSEVVQIASPVEEAANNFLEGVTSSASEIKESMKSSTESAQDAVSDFTSDSFDILKSAAGDAAHSVSDTVNALNSTLKEGVNDVSNAVKSAATSATDAVSSLPQFVNKDVIQNDIADQVGTEQVLKTIGFLSEVECVTSQTTLAETDAKSDLQNGVLSADNPKQLHSAKEEHDSRQTALNGLKVDEQIAETLVIASDQLTNKGEVENTLRSTVERAITEEKELRIAMSVVNNEVVKTTESLIKTEKDETVMALELAEASVQAALDQAQMTISTEVQKAQSLTHDIFQVTDPYLPQETQQPSFPTPEEQGETSAQLNIKSVDTTEQALELAEKSVRQALDRAEQTISSESKKASIMAINGQMKTEENNRNTDGSENQLDGIANSSLSPKTISSGSQSTPDDSGTAKTGLETEELLEKTVTTASLVHQLSESIHERVRREVMSLKDSPRGNNQDGTTRRGRHTSDITIRKVPVKSDSWESNLRKSTLASSAKMSKNTSANDVARKKQQPATRIPKKIPSNTLHEEVASSKPTSETKRKVGLRKAKSMADDSGEDSKKRVKKMPSLGSTKKTAIFVESAVEAAGETFANQAIEKEKTRNESEDDVSDGTSKSISVTTSSGVGPLGDDTNLSAEKSQDIDLTSKKELVQAAATIQDTFRGISDREQKVT